MMRGKEITGLPVYDASEGKKLGSIKDIVLDIDSRKVMGFTVDTGGLFGPGHKVLPMEEIKSIGPDAVMVSDKTHAVLHDENREPGIKKILEEGHSVYGKKILTRSGKELGAVSDIMVDTDSGVVSGYEISGGVARDIGRGRPVVPMMDDFTAGEDAIVVPDETEKRMEESVGGLAGAYESTKEKAGELAEKGKGRVQQQYGETRERVETTVSKGKERLETEEVEAAKGRIAGYEVTADDGTVIVSKGQEVDDAVIDRARQYGKVHQVAMSSGVTGFQEKYEEYGKAATDQIGRAEEELLLGRTAGQKVTDREGNVIVNDGDKIEFDSMQRARQAGVMGDLIAAAGIAGARSWWESIRNSVTHYRERGEHASARASQRRFLVGRISDTEVSGKNGEVIIREGEVITPIMVEKAKDANKLAEIRVRPE
ncbi:MAG: PRC-barrel domain-containing protein [bacterium]|nr:PRC-barrel domain-containing protein [bacterium]